MPAEISVSSVPGAITFEPEPAGEGKMVRDMEVVRAIVRHLMERTDLDPKPVEVDGFDPVVVARHAEMLYDIGWIDGTKFKPLNGPPRVTAKDLTWEGHEMGGGLLNDSVWAEIKKTLKPAEIAMMPLKVLGSLAMKLATAWAMKKAGLE